VFNQFSVDRDTCFSFVRHIKAHCDDSQNPTDVKGRLLSSEESEITSKDGKIHFQQGVCIDTSKPEGDNRTNNKT